MKNFTHGIMIIDPLNPNDINTETYSVVHFVGYWEEPTDADADNLKEELKNDSEFELQNVVDRLIFLPATEDCLKYYNDLCEIDGVFQEPNLN